MKRKKQLAQPGEQALSNLRFRLILWYSSIFGLAFCGFCLALYLIVQQILLGPLPGELSMRTAVRLMPGAIEITTCLPPIPPPNNIREKYDYLICFDIHGKKMDSLAVRGESIPDELLSGDLLARTIESKQVKHDIINTNNGRLIRVITPLYAEGDTVLIGYRMLAMSLQDIDQTLQLLAMTMASLGLGVLLVSILGSIFLANRAIQPARMAFARQTRFIADASHELRTPLTFLQADTELLLAESEDFSDDQRSLIEEVALETKHISRLVQHMLTLTRTEAQQQMEIDIINAQELVQRLGKRIEAFALSKQISIHTEAEAPLRLPGDSLYIEQALLTLLENALQYTPEEKHITLQAFREGSHVCFVVKDTGVGIASEHLPHLGERFYRVDKGRSRASGGTGLGLSIVRSIVAMHQGSVHFASEPGKGTTVILRFPALP